MQEHPRHTGAPRGYGGAHFGSRYLSRRSSRTTSILWSTSSTARVLGAQAHCGRFFSWYNHEHRHSGIGLHIPADVHYGRADAIREKRAAVLTAAYAAHPERFVRKAPEPPALPAAAWINQPEGVATTTQ